ncbi:glycosyltransferase family 61 protein [Rhodoblastus sp.]|uniref:glycosyltransferase family 61 protein n=1 Tax=Rhodoblastus sp. TaxID=1962975 RepID=UPI003F951368
MKFVQWNELFASGGGGAKFHQIAPANRAVPSVPDFLFGNAPREVMEAYFKLQWVHEQGVIELDAQVYWPYLVQYGDATLCVPVANMHKGHLAAIWRPAPSCKREIPSAVLLCGPGHRIFGHWLVDHLPKLYVLQTAGYDLSKLRFIMPHDAPGFAVELLRLCGISEQQFVELKPDELLSGHIMIPTTVHNGARGPLFAEVAQFLRERMGIVASRGAPRLFLSRAKTSQSRPCGNRDAIERMAVEAGYSLISPEKLPLSMQFSVIAGAEVVMGEYGSQMHSTLFGGPSQIVCALRGSSGLGFIQSAIGSALHQPTGYVFGETDPNDKARGFSVPEEAFQMCLEAIDRM